MVGFWHACFKLSKNGSGLQQCCDAAAFCVIILNIRISLRCFPMMRYFSLKICILEKILQIFGLFFIFVGVGGLLHSSQLGIIIFQQFFP